MDAGEEADVADPTICPDGLPRAAWNAEPGGVNRRDLAGDFTVATVDGAEFTLSTAWTGCESFVFIPDQVPVSQTDATSVWASDLDQLLGDSPPNVHYFFVSTRSSASSAERALDSMQEQLEQVLGEMEGVDFQHWLQRVHVVATPAPQLESWLKDTFVGAGRQGFAIDRQQVLQDAPFRLGEIAPAPACLQKTALN